MTSSLAPEPPSDKIARIVDGLARDGWTVCEDFIDPALTAQLRAEAERLHAQGLYHQAGIGRGEGYRVHTGIRGDRILWLDEAPPGGAARRYGEALECLRAALNREWFLGLFTFEGHFAFYPPGMFYRRHLDQHQGAASRVVTCVLYLNEDWPAGDGGELRLYLNGADGQGETRVDIAPRGGTLACFLSADIPHEVLATARARYSIAGWFRRRE